MWTIDARCSQCGNKAACKDRPAILGDLSPLTNILNTVQEHLDSPGDGILIVACNDFRIA